MDRLKNSIQGNPTNRRPNPQIRPEQDRPQRPQQHSKAQTPAGPKGPAPKPQKKLKPSEDPDNIYCARCAIHHHRDLHTGGRNTGL